MNVNQRNYFHCSSCADLVGVILTNFVISYISYLGSRDSFTGEIKLKHLVFKLLMHWGSYLIVYVILIRRNHFFKVPRWLLISLMGSLLAAVTFGLPFRDADLEGVAARLMIFGVIALIVMGVVRAVFWLFKRMSSFGFAPVSPMHDG